MISLIRDLLTVGVFAAIIIGLIVHTIRIEFATLFPAGRKASRVKFQGSARTWVK